jgi:signal transduction histidine kinase/CheY-like chemotaxis protein
VQPLGHLLLSTPAGWAAWQLGCLVAAALVVILGVAWLRTRTELQTLTRATAIDTLREGALLEQLGKLLSKGEAAQVTSAKLDRFLSTLAHELRGPLASLLVATDQLEKVVGEEQPAHKLAGIAHRQVRHLRRLIEDVCDMNRVNHGRLSIRPASVDMKDIALEAAEAVEPLTEEKGQRLELQLDAEAFIVFGDSARLVQVTFNLLSNASRYSGEGATIVLALTRSAGHAVLTVRDSGIGISEGNLGGIFELFSQVAPLSIDSKDGFGLGLALVQELVGLHRGRVEAASPGLGHGSTFRVFLPLERLRSRGAQAETAVRATPTAQTVPSVAAVVVRSVIVDDEVDYARSLAIALEADGVQVRLAHDGEEAFSTIEDFKPHVVFMDLTLPRMSGHELARKIRAQGWGRSVRLVAVSGHDRAADHQASLDEGFDAHLTKPVDLAVLRQMLSTAVGV